MKPKKGLKNYKNPNEIFKLFKSIKKKKSKVEAWVNKTDHKKIWKAHMEKITPYSTEIVRAIKKKQEKRLGTYHQMIIASSYVLLKTMSKNVGWQKNTKWVENQCGGANS